MWTADSTVLEVYGLISAAASSYTLTDICVFLFVGVGELGFCPCCFFVGMEDDLTYILVTSSSMVIGLMGESLSLEISIGWGLLCIPQHFPTAVRNSHLHSTTYTLHPTTLELNSTSTLFATQLNTMVLSTCIEHLIIASSGSIIHHYQINHGQHN